MKQIFAPHLNRFVKCGGRRPRKPGLARLHFSDFVQHAKMPPIPPTFDYSPKASVPLADIYGNDALGDCVIAMVFHAAAVFTGNATGTPYHVKLAQIVDYYSKIGGYVPGKPDTDQGCVITDALDYWQKTGLPNGGKILGYISVNAASFTDVLAAAYLFENLCFGVALPDAYIDPFPSGSGFTWGKTGAIDPNNGHAFLGLGGVSSGSKAGVKIDTWGLLGTFTPDAIAAYAGPTGGGECWAVITTDILAKGETKAPNGVAWRDLVLAFNGMGGHVAVPPLPEPTPPPVVGGVSLAQAEAAVKRALAGQPWLLNRDMAVKIAMKGLESLMGWTK